MTILVPRRLAAGDGALWFRHDQRGRVVRRSTALLEQDSDVGWSCSIWPCRGFRAARPDLFAGAISGDPVVIVSASDMAGTIRRSLDFGARLIQNASGSRRCATIMKVMEGDVGSADTDLSVNFRA